MNSDTKIVNRMPVEADVQRLRKRFGVPTAPMVKLLQETFGQNLKPQTQIPYAEIEKCLGMSRDLPRWKTVVNRWRKELEADHNILLLADRTAAGYEVATGNARLRFSARGYCGAMKNIRRVAHVAQRTGELELTPDKVRWRDHFVSHTASVLLAHETEAKRLEYPVPEKQNNGKSA